VESSFFLPIPPEQALEECKRLDLERFNLKLVPIPAEGGCVIAIIPCKEEKARSQRRWTEFFSGIRKRRAVSHALAQLKPALALGGRLPAYRSAAS